MTPSQVRYQAALHPDMKSASGKELGKFLPEVPNAMEHFTHGFFKEPSRSTILADGSLHPQLVEGDDQDPGGALKTKCGEVRGAFSNVPDA